MVLVEASSRAGSVVGAKARPKKAEEGVKKPAERKRVPIQWREEGQQMGQVPEEGRVRGNTGVRSEGAGTESQGGLALRGAGRNPSY